MQRPAGAYIFFCQDRRPDVKKKNPDLSAPDVLRELGALWSKATDEDKKVKPEPIGLLLAIAGSSAVDTGVFHHRVVLLGSGNMIALLTESLWCSHSMPRQRKTRSASRKKMQRECI